MLSLINWHLYFFVLYCISMDFIKQLGLVKFTKLLSTIGFDYVILIFFHKIITLLAFTDIALEYHVIWWDWLNVIMHFFIFDWECKINKILFTYWPIYKYLINSMIFLVRWDIPLMCIQRHILQMSDILHHRSISRK